MAPTKSLVWLASYPKSGNTWMRIFLANYLFNLDKPVPINEVHRIGMGDSIAKAYEKVAKGAFDPGDVRQTLRLRTPMLRAIANNGAEVNFVKTHNRNARISDVELVPNALTRSAIYILRDPRDLVLSYARHYAQTPAVATQAIAAPTNFVMADATATTQWLGSWSEHVSGWLGEKRFPVLALRYEDMQTDPAETFGKALSFIGVPADPARLERAIRFSSFDEVRAQEDKTGFVERSAVADRFFSKGTSGQWHSDLDPALADQIVAAQGTVMRLHGYI